MHTDRIRSGRQCMNVWTARNTARIQGEPAGSGGGLSRVSPSPSSGKGLSPGTRQDPSITDEVPQGSVAAV